MLWSLFKILFFVALVAAIAFGIQELLGMSGDVTINFAGREAVIPPLAAIIGLLVLALALWVVFKIAGLLVSVLRWINGDETAFSRYAERRRERKGYAALSESLVALASGEARDAAAKAQKAERYLGRPDLTDMLVAQASEAAGEKDKAMEAYKRLVKNDTTRFVGVRGLMRQKLEAGDTETAMKLAEKAFALKPRHVETQDTLLQLQARDQNWEGARRVLTAKLKSGALPKDVYKRREAVLSLADARARQGEGNEQAAREEALEANRLSPELVPAAVMAAQMHVAAGDKRRATKAIKAAWQKIPHPDLAAAFAAIEPDETPDARIKRFQPLLRLDATNRATRMLEAELYLAAEDFPAARRALGDLAETKPTARTLSLMAAIERGEGASEAVVRGWLAKALTAPRGPQWVCEKCGTVHAAWVPVCSSCEAFDSLEWGEARRAEGAEASVASEMLPLLVGDPQPSAPVPVPTTSAPAKPDTAEDAELVDAEPAAEATAKT